MGALLHSLVERVGSSPHTDSFPPVCLDLPASLGLSFVPMQSGPEVEVPLVLSSGAIPTQEQSWRINITAFRLASWRSVGVFAAKPDSASSKPGTHVVKGENRLLGSVL